MSRCHLWECVVNVKLNLSRTTGDGNCLYNACSIALCGTEDLAVYLRCLTSIELYLNAPFYASHPIFEQQHNKGAFTSVANAFSMCLSDIALASFRKDYPSDSVMTEAYVNSVNRQWSSFLCLLGLSSVLELPIESYFPTTAKQGGLQEEKDSLSVMFNCTIFPRESSSSSDDRIHLFRCALMPAGYLESMRVPERKNHYVALCAPKDASLEMFDLQTFISKPVTLSTSLSATKAEKASVMTTPSTPLTPSISSPRFTPTSTSSTISKENLSLSTSVSKKSKKKQMVLDSLLPKKRKLEETDGKEKEHSKQKCRDGGATSLDTKLTTSTPSEPSLQVACLKEGTTTNPDSEESKFSNDIGNYINIPLTEQLKYHILCNVWSPPSNYNFPLNEEKRRFRFEWLKIFPWLTYSEKFDGAFCLNCVLFGSESATMHNTTKLQRLFKLPLRSWNVATARFREHSEKSELHKTATTRAAMFKSYMESKSIPIDAMLDKVKKQQIEENRKQLRPIIRAIILCGRQNIALRGHRDDSKYHLSDDVNPGNFIEVLKYGVTCAGQSLEEYFKMTPKNLTYRSKTTQNEIIDICDELITNKITDEIREAKFFSILADEASDCGNVEQLSVVIRFVDRQHRIREEFLGFVPCKNGLSGEAIANTIQDFLRERGLSIDDCRGQGYDGAGNMAGRISGAAAKIQAIQNKAIYVHCNSHILNLCVASCCKELLVSNMLEHVRVVSEFFNFSPKRFEFLVKTIKEMLPDANHTRLINVCKTRWVARIDGLDTFIDVFIAIVKCLEVIKANVDRTWNPESVNKAFYLFHATVSFSFIAPLIFVSRCLEVTRPLTVQLQDSALDAASARKKVSDLFVQLEKVRREIDERHTRWFQEAESLAKSVGTLPEKPRTVNRQQHRPNTPADSPSEYYRRVVTIPFLDHLKSQIQSRFSENNLDVMDAVYGLPKNVLIYPDWRTKFSKFLKKYMNDLPLPRFLDTELEMWSRRCRMEKGVLPSKLSEVLPFTDKMTFPNIYTAFQIFATIPVTTCTCERSISVLRRLKTYLRSTMTES